MLTAHGVGFSWKAGQHVLLWCPTLAPLESHPFTIANLPMENRGNGLQTLQLIIRAHSGFTRKLFRQATSSTTVTVFLTGPFGNLPVWNTYETLILISASTGASFSLPLLESVLNDPCCVTMIYVLVLVRHRSHLDAYLSRLQAAFSHPRSSELSLHIMVAITGKQVEPMCEDGATSEISSLSTSSSLDTSAKTLAPSCTNTTRNHSSTFEKAEVDCASKDSTEEEEHNVGVRHKERYNSSRIAKGSSLQYMTGRPNLANFVRNPVEASAGESSVIVCGGKSLTSTVRNCVATLSDERAVHKGTGAQGIHLHVEEFGL